MLRLSREPWKSTSPTFSTEVMRVDSYQLNTIVEYEAGRIPMTIPALPSWSFSSGLPWQVWLYLTSLKRLKIETFIRIDLHVKMITHNRQIYPVALVVELGYSWRLIFQLVCHTLQNNIWMLPSFIWFCRITVFKCFHSFSPLKIRYYLSSL